jgi:hypothetical protein
MFGAPTVQNDFQAFGWSIAAVNGYRLMLVGEQARNLGNAAGAGQVYIVRLN